jgi:hypothetical protein
MWPEMNRFSLLIKRRMKVDSHTKDSLMETSSFDTYGVCTLMERVQYLTSLALWLRFIGLIVVSFLFSQALQHLPQLMPVFADSFINAESGSKLKDSTKLELVTLLKALQVRMNVGP